MWQSILHGQIMKWQDYQNAKTFGIINESWGRILTTYYKRIHRNDLKNTLNENMHIIGQEM